MAGETTSSKFALRRNRSTMRLGAPAGWMIALT
jgi:hypothetical protein